MKWPNALQKIPQSTYLWNKEGNLKPSCGYETLEVALWQTFYSLKVFTDSFLLHNFQILSILPTTHSSHAHLT